MYKLSEAGLKYFELGIWNKTEYLLEKNVSGSEEFPSWFGLLYNPVESLLIILINSGTEF